LLSDLKLAYPSR